VAFMIRRLVGFERAGSAGRDELRNIHSRV
jgi:hypothetical protein